MRILLDAAHPADVWAFSALEDRLLLDGHETLWVSRPGKECVVDLIEARGRPHVPGPAAGVGGLGLARELLLRDWRMWRTVRAFRPDVILTRSPAGVHAGRLCRTPVLYDTDDGKAAGLLYWAAAPFADVVTGPAAGIAAEPLSRLRPLRSRQAPHNDQRRRSYQGYKELFYLHPQRFVPDPQIRAEIGCEPHERLFLMRISAFAAAHDRREHGLSRPLAEEILAMLERRGRVLVSSESRPPERWAGLVAPIAPQRFHHLLAACDLVVGDSQTVAAEAAVLGALSFRYSSWVGRLRYLAELEHRWQLLASFGPGDEECLLTAIEEALDDLDASAARQRRRRAAMLRWCEDPDEQVRGWASFVHHRGSSYDAHR